MIRSRNRFSTIVPVSRYIRISDVVLICFLHDRAAVVAPVRQVVASRAVMTEVVERQVTPTLCAALRVVSVH